MKNKDGAKVLYEDVTKPKVKKDKEPNDYGCLFIIIFIIVGMVGTTIGDLKMSKQEKLTYKIKVLDKTHSPPGCPSLKVQRYDIEGNIIHDIHHKLEWKCVTSYRYENSEVGNTYLYSNYKR